MKRFLQSALAASVLILFSTPLFALNLRAESQSEAEIRALKEQIEQIQRQNQKQIEELRKKIDELESKKEAKVPEKEKFLSNFDAGYKDGLFLKTRDDKFSLKFNALFQGQFFIQNFDDRRGTTPSDEQISFQIRRLRLIFSGNGFAPWVRYYIQIGADKGANFELKDTYLDFAYYPEITPRIGQWKVPFQREELTQDALLEFADRSIVNDEFTFERDLGFELYGSLLNNLIEYAGGVFNGAGRNVEPNPNGPNLLYAGRVVFEPFGKYEYSQGDLRDDPSKPLFAIGAAVAGLPNFSLATENGSNRADLAKTILAIDKNITNADVFQFTADVGFKYYGFAFEGEYDLRRIFHIQSTAAINDATTGQGLRLQAGYLLLPPHFEVAFRYAIIDPNNHKGGDRKQEFTPALSYYIYKHRLKIAADYSLLLKQDSSGGNFKDNRFRIQTQLYF